MIHMRLNGIVGEYTPALQMVIDKRKTVSEKEIEQILLAHPASPKTVALFNGSAMKVGEGKDVNFGLLLDNYRAGKVKYSLGYLLMNPEKISKSFLVEVFYT